jgi:hypothetical protein
MHDVTVRVPGRDDDVFGEVPLAPSALTGLSELQLARAMAASFPMSPESASLQTWAPAALRSDRLKTMAAWARR